MAGSTILIVEDEPAVARGVQVALEREGYAAVIVGTGEDAVSRFEEIAPDLAVVDVRLPGIDGFEVVRRLRRETRAPILFLTARSDEVDKVVGLEIGADDYLVKPFNPRELLARMRNVLRRWDLAPRGVQANATRRYHFADWTLDVGARELVDLDGARQGLTGAEYRLLLAFLSNPNRVLSRHELIELTRTRKTELFDRSVDVRISRLRQLLKDTGGTSNLIKTVYGDGYVFSATVEIE